MKTIFFTLALLLTFPLSSSAFQLFPDVPTTHEDFTAITVLQDREIVNGFGDGLFRPDEKVSRAAALKIILLAGNVTPPAAVQSQPFPDVPVGEWYAPYAKKAQDLGIAKGDGNGNFVPSRYVSKAEAIAMLFRINGNTLPDVEEMPFDDVPTYAWYAPYFVLAKETGLVSGDFANPDHELSRAELSDITYRFFRSDWFASEMEGKASYYGDGFNGRTTANGEVFSNDDYVAAHKTLPFGTHVRVRDIENLKSVVVRITDRGPYVAGRVIDLSKKSFEVLAPASAGVTAVELETVSDTTPLGPELSCDLSPEMHNLATDAFDGLELSYPISTTMRRGQIWHVEGNSSAESVTAILKAGNTEIFRTTAVVNNGNFQLPLVFQETGEHQLMIIPGKSGTGSSYPITVIAPDCEEEKGENSKAPTDLVTDLQDGAATLSWDAHGNNLFRIRFSQGETELVLYHLSSAEIMPPTSIFEHFDEGLVRVEIWGAQATGDIFHRTSNWNRGIDEQIIALKQHRVESGEISVSAPERYSYGQAVTIRATGDDIKPEIYIMNPRGEIVPKALTQREDAYELRWTPSYFGPYVYEMLATDGRVLHMGTIYPEGTTPLLPGEEEERQVETTVSQSEYEAVMLALVNEERKQKGVANLSYDENIAKLAQFRADDMCDQDYLSHTDTDGKEVNDYRALFGVQSRVAENIAESADLQAAHDNFMLSLSHRQSILNPEYSRVGFGFCTRESGELVTVQLFGLQPFEADKTDLFREQIIGTLNDHRQSALVPSATLESLAQYWAEKMAAEGTLAFQFDDESLATLLQDTSVDKPAKALIFQIGNIDDLLGELPKNTIELGGNQENFFLQDKYAKMGIGIAQDEVWNLYVVLLAIER